MDPEKQTTQNIQSGITADQLPDIVFADHIPAIATPEIIKTQRHFLAAFFFSLLWGFLGVDRFYLGKYGTGILKLLTLGGFGLWAMSDLSSIMSGRMRDKNGNKMLEFERYKKLARNTFAIYTTLILVIVVASIGSVAYFVMEFFQGGGLDALLNSNIQPENIKNILNI